MNRKEHSFMMVSNKQKPLVSMVYIKTIQRFKGQRPSEFPRTTLTSIINKIFLTGVPDSVRFSPLNWRLWNKGFCQVKTIPKIREKLGSGWVEQAPTGIFFFLKYCVFCVIFIVVHVSKKNKKLDRRVGGWCLDNPTFARIFGIVLTWQNP